MSTLADLYRAERRAQSASMIYVDQPAPVQRPSIYVDSDYSLENYSRTPPRSRYEQAPGESDHGYIQRLAPLLQHLAETLPADELEAVAKSFNAAVQRVEGGTSHAQLREQLDARKAGGGVMAATPQERAAALGSRFGGREIAGQGHVTPGSLSARQPASAAQVNVLIQQREEAQRAQPRATQIPTGSSGEGWLTR
jgi:HAMP domain-containing protein